MDSSRLESPIDAQWVAQCAHRLRQRWPHADPTSLEEAACELWCIETWRACAPEAAAERWLRLGASAETERSEPRPIR